MNNRPNIVRGDLKTSPAVKNLKTETTSSAVNQPDSVQPAGKGSRFSSVGDGEQSEAKNAEVVNDAKVEEAGPDDTGITSAETAFLEKEKKFSGRCRLFVGNLPNDLTDNEFQKFFEPFGELNEVFLNAARGFGFIRLVSMFTCNCLFVLVFFYD